MSKVFDPMELKNIRLKNRIVRSATVDPFGNKGGTVSDAQVELYRTLAENNVGLIIAAQSGVADAGRISDDQNLISRDSFIDSHRRLTDAVHKAGSKIILQISHCGAGAMSIDGNPPMAPSDVPYPGSKVIPRPLAVAEIEEIIGQFIAAAVRAKAAGYDGVQVHGAHGYLLSSFINPVQNKRTDEYGGGIENRFKMAEKVIRGIVNELGPDYPVLLKINSNIEENDETYYSDLVYVAKTCKSLGVSAIEYSGYNFTPLGRKGLHNYYMDRVSALRREVDLPVILVGGVRSLQDMDAVLSSGIDMVSLSRPFICEPDLVTRLRNGQEKATCISCSKCFYLYYKEGRRCVFHEAKS
ncbi:HisA/HisF-related TIM barrel protein [Papillibacter cinnamivorans]|uniref:2,4-dienoyl-CoA reductase n=1 Tax=Papillibacter cinnamivorans DSM 12816 TaxID=1122930 RepID=A0A1W1ZGN9_9FIRM|nr:NADH:flavin oxidoreductase [Papillibacter cinnamivorans]SMC47198.1 2,4-dienoyl-CoA reductase [Papillibacter cinnamivorans DSM 12816]